tara:strand:- start:1265 stop:1564 length:300 start_codon:yes stop_codon:yes gene_type:complete
MYIDFQDAFNFNMDNNLFKVFYQSVTDPKVYKTEPSILIYDIKENLKVNINDKEILITDPFFNLKYSEINSFGYYLNDSYIDLTYIFKEKRTTSIDTND